MPPITKYVPDTRFRHYEGDHIGDKPSGEELFPAGSPKYDDIVQTHEKACFFLAPIAALAKRDPDAIKKMMNDNGDGTVTVHFYAYDNHEKKKVPYDVKVDKTATALDSKSALWVNLFQKAYAASGLHRSVDLYPEEDHYINKPDEGPIDMLERDPTMGMAAFGGTARYYVIDAGTPEQVLRVLDPKADSTPSQETSKDIIHSRSEDEAYEKFRSAVLAAAENNCLMFIKTNASHVIPVLGVEKKNGRYCAHYYNQKGTEGLVEGDVDLRDLFNGQGEISKYQKAVSIDFVSPDHTKMENIYFSTVRSKLAQENKELDRKTFLETVRNCIISKYGLDKIAPDDRKNEAADRTENSCAEHFLKYDKTMYMAIQHEADRFIGRKKTLYDLNDLLNTEGNSIIKNIESSLRTCAEHSKSPIMTPLLRERIKSVIPPARELKEEENPGYLNTYKKQMTDYAAELDKKKTKFGISNSKEYQAIIDSLKNFDSKTVPDSMKNLSTKQVFAVRLLDVQKKIDAYIEHKARDGVKSNVYEKLAAVQEVSETVSRYMQSLELPGFEHDGQIIGKYSADASYNRKYNDFRDNAQNDSKDRAPKPLNYSATDISQQVMQKYPNASRGMVSSVDECMCKIILKSIDLKLPEDKIQALENKRCAFACIKPSEQEKYFTPPKTMVL